MSVKSIRPRVSDLMFVLYGRSLHPELFDIREQGVIRQPDYTATIRICDTGHVVTFQSTGSIVTEIVIPKGHPLPEHREILHRKLKGSRDESHPMECGGAYHLSFQVEKLDPEIFLNMHEELQRDCQRAPISHCFGSTNRLSPAALSFVQTDVWPRSLLIHAFHTFPEDCAIVKTQSLFELSSR